jgi:hypothetical protein
LKENSNTERPLPMNINPDFASDNNLDAETAMQACMDAIAITLLEPAMEKGELSEDDQNFLGIIGITLKTIAEKARAFEELQDGTDQGNHFRN